MARLERTFTLDDRGTDGAIEAVAQYLEDGDYSHDDAVRLRLSFDAMLMSWRAAGLDGHECTVCEEKSTLRRRISVTVKGLTPATESALAAYDRTTDFFAQTMGTLGLEWTTDITPGRILAEIPLPKKSLNENLVLLLAVVAGIVAFLAISALPGSVGSQVTDGVLTPLYDRIVGMLTGIAGPYVFISLVCSTVGMGSVQTLKSKGKVIVTHYLLASLLALCVSMVVVIAFFGVQLSGSSSSGGQFGAIMGIILDIFPINLVDPFLQNNILQVVVLGVLVGVALLALGQATEKLAALALELQRVVSWVFAVLLKLMPVFIFLATIQIIGSFDSSQLMPLLRMFIAIAVSCVLFTLGHLLVTRARTGVDLKTLFGACLPGGTIGFLTTSQAASVPAIQEHVTGDLKVSPDLANLSVPIGLVLHQPVGTQVYLCAVAFGCAFSGRVLTPQDLLMAFVVCYLLNMATPPVPGGPLLVYAVVFAQLGLSSDAAAIVVALNFLTDMISTGASLFTLPAEILLISRASSEPGKEGSAA